MSDFREERTIIGKWIPQGDRTVADEACAWIKRLTSEVFRQVAEREGGWRVLYVDPSTGSYWELTYPESQMHGGGPPMLTRLDPDEVQTYYPQLKS
jgi:hypothetical protein